MNPHDGCNCPNHHASQHDHDHAHDHDHNHEHGDVETRRKTYRGYGVEFDFPSEWMLNDESSADQDSITVQSPGTSFWTAMLFEGRPDPERVLSTAQSAFEEEYEELDVYESTVTVMGIPAFAREVEFVCLDLITTAFLVSFQTLDRTVLLMFQGEDRELKSTRPILEAMTRSFSCDLQRIPDGPTVDT